MVARRCALRLSPLCRCERAVLHTGFDREHGGGSTELVRPNTFVAIFGEPRLHNGFALPVAVVSGILPTILPGTNVA